jgi:hypothetical protein
MRGLEPRHENFLVLASIDLGRIGAFQEKLYRLSEIGGCFLHRWALAGNVQLRTESHEKISLSL